MASVGVAERRGSCCLSKQSGSIGGRDISSHGVASRLFGFQHAGRRNLTNPFESRCASAESGKQWISMGPSLTGRAELKRAAACALKVLLLGGWLGMTGSTDRRLVGPRWRRSSYHISISKVFWNKCLEVTHDTRLRPGGLGPWPSARCGLESTGTKGRGTFHPDQCGGETGDPILSNVPCAMETRWTSLVLALSVSRNKDCRRLEARRLPTDSTKRCSG